MVSLDLYSNCAETEGIWENIRQKMGVWNWSASSLHLDYYYASDVLGWLTPDCHCKIDINAKSWGNIPTKSAAYPPP